MKTISPHIATLPALSASLRNTFITAIFITLLSANATAATLVVTLKNVVNSNGMVTASLCDKDSFLKACAHTQSEKAASGAMVLTFKDVPPGKYAVSAYHDENDNKKLDRNFIGIPKEATAFSRDARGKRGPPTFEDAVFEVKEDKKEIAITLVY